MNLRIELKSGVMTASLRGELDHHTAGALREEIDSTAQKVKPTLLRLDFSEVPVMDSSGIGLILGRYRMMKGRGGTLSVRCTSARQLLVMKMAGLEKLQILQQERTENHETDQ